MMSNYFIFHQKRYFLTKSTNQGKTDPDFKLMGFAILMQKLKICLTSFPDFNKNAEFIEEICLTVV